jgi:hypothetical protein
MLGKAPATWQATTRIISLDSGIQSGLGLGASPLRRKNLIMIEGTTMKILKASLAAIAILGASGITYAQTTAQKEATAKTVDADVAAENFTAVNTLVTLNPDLAYAIKAEAIDDIVALAKSSNPTTQSTAITDAEKYAHEFTSEASTVAAAVAKVLPASKAVIVAEGIAGFGGTADGIAAVAAAVAQVQPAESATIAAGVAKSYSADVGVIAGAVTKVDENANPTGNKTTIENTIASQVATTVGGGETEAKVETAETSAASSVPTVVTSAGTAVTQAATYVSEGTTNPVSNGGIVVLT